MSDEQPYLYTSRIAVIREYNPRYSNDRICVCGHPYYRHFDAYDEMHDCGCKYCPCYEFKEISIGANNEKPK